MCLSRRDGCLARSLVNIPGCGFKKIELLSSLIRGLKVFTIGLSTLSFSEFPDLP